MVTEDFERGIFEHGNNAEVEKAMMSHVEKCSLTIAPAFATILLMEEIFHQIWSISHFITGLYIYIPGGSQGFLSINSTSINFVATSTT